MTKPAPKRKSAPKTAEYTASLIVLGKTYKATGASVTEALQAVKCGIARGKGILTITHGSKSKERILSPVHTTRIFNTAGMAREVALKNISLMFDGI